MMIPSEIREARRSLGLTQAQLAALLETTPRVVRSIEADDDASTHRAPPVRVVRLLRAYLDGWRPPDWPA